MKSMTDIQKTVWLEYQFDSGLPNIGGYVILLQDVWQSTVFEIKRVHDLTENSAEHYMYIVSLHL